MEELRHPPVEIDPSLFANPERAFAQRAYTALETYSLIGQSYILGEPVRFPVTDRVDMPVADDSTVEIAMRLVGTPTYQLPDRNASPSLGITACEESSEYIVVELQYGELAEDDIEDGVEDEDFDWRPYIVVVIDAHKPYAPFVLDAQTGRPLSAADLMTASITLEQVCAELESTTLDRAAYYATQDEMAVTDEYGYRQFNTEDFMPLSECESCGESTPCPHNPGALN